MRAPGTRDLWLAAAALSALTLFPLLLVDVPAVLDYPNHLARWLVLAYPDDPHLSRFYAANWHITPNLGFDPAAMLLLRLVPVHDGGRLVLALALLLPPLSVMAYSRAAFGRIGVWPLMAMLLAFNGIFFLGFLNFLLATSLAFGAAGLWLVLRRRGDDSACMLMGAAATAVIFLCHVFGVALFALLVASQEFSSRRERALPRGLAMLAFALLPAALLYFLSPLASHAAAVGGLDTRHKLWGLFTPFMIYAKPLTLATGLAVFALVILCWRGAVLAPGTEPALLLLALCFLAAPVSLKGGSFLDVRVALMMGMLLFAGLSPRLGPKRQWALLAILLLLAGARSLDVSLAWMEHRGDVADLRAAIAQVAPGSRVLTARAENPATDPGAPARALPDVYRLDNHLPALVLIERRAFWPFLFADPVQQTVRERPPYDRMVLPLSDPVEWKDFQKPLTASLVAANPYLKNWRADFDYVLLVDRPPALNPPPGLVLLYAGPYAALYRIAR